MTNIYVYDDDADTIETIADDAGLGTEDVIEAAWSAYARDATEYKSWCFVDGVEDGLFEDTDSDYAAFDRMWKQAETDMAQLYA